MKFNHSLMVLLLMSSMSSGWAWADEATATTADQTQVTDAGGRGGGGGGGQRPPQGGGGQRPQQPQPIRPQPEPVRPQPQPIRPQPEPIRPQPIPVRPDPVPVRPVPVPIRPAPPIIFRPGPNGRAFDPVQIHEGVYAGIHWVHPDFERPVYQWNWDSLVNVTCSAEDSVGNIYPVTESEYVGPAYQAQMANVEDAALDMCYDDSNGDSSCYLLGCAPGY